MDLSIIVPVSDEERTIAEVLGRVAAFDTQGLGFTSEIIVCDDGSHDSTAAIVKRMSASLPSVRLLRHERNLGKGAAIRSALREARGEFTLIQDADLEYDVQDYGAILSALKQGADAVYGSRFLGRRYPPGMLPMNFVANKILTATANLLYGSRITDEATCLKAIRTSLLRSFNLECERFDFCPEVTAKLGLRRIPIVEVEVSYRARGAREGKKIRWTDGLEALWVLVKYRVG